MATIELVKNLASKWLAGEEAYQTKKFTTLYATDLAGRSKFLIEEEIPAKWEKSAEIRADYTWEAIDQSNQLILKILAASRAAIVFSEEAETAEESVLQARMRVYQTACFNDIKEKNLPGRPWLYEPEFSEIFEARSPSYLFQRAAALTMTALMETGSAYGDITLPAPGVPTGTLLEWDPAVRRFDYASL